MSTVAASAAITVNGWAALAALLGTGVLLIAGALRSDARVRRAASVTPSYDGPDAEALHRAAIIAAHHPAAIEGGAAR
jgi:hypothetical protein